MRLKKSSLLAGSLLIFGIANIATASFIYSNHEYDLTPILTWLEAEAWAVAWGGHLVTINDQAEQDWLAATFPHTLYKEIHIGMNDIAQEGDWVWSSGEPVIYTNWLPGEPNDANGIEDIGVMNWGHDGLGIPYTDGWNDLSLGHSSWGIMERSIPEPSTILLLTTGLSSMVAYGFRRKKKA